MYNLYNLNKQGDNMDNHKKKLSIKDIAAISGVSIATVSRVLNNKGGYSKETEEKINALAKSYGYVSNMNAKSLRESKSQTIGLIVPDISNDFFATLALHIKIIQQNITTLFLFVIVQIMFKKKKIILKV